MKVRNKKTGNILTTTQFEFDSLIVKAGNAYLYEILEDDAPIEVREMRKVNIKSDTKKPKND